jgi:hypothetical protein
MQSRLRRAIEGAVLVAAVGGWLVALQSCNATGEFEGGDTRFDAGLLALATQTLDDGGVTFTDLYKDFFGPVKMGATASCTLNAGACHAGPTESGTMASIPLHAKDGYMCVPDQAGCYASMVDAGLIVPDSKDPSAGNFPLTHVLRHLDPATGLVPDCSSVGSCMPYKPTSRVFTPGEMQRIQTWIMNGAHND